MRGERRLAAAGGGNKSGRPGGFLTNFSRFFLFFSGELVRLPSCRAVLLCLAWVAATGGLWSRCVGWESALRGRQPVLRPLPGGRRRRVSSQLIGHGHRSSTTGDYASFGKCTSCLNNAVKLPRTPSKQYQLHGDKLAARKLITSYDTKSFTSPPFSSYGKLAWRP